MPPVCGAPWLVVNFESLIRGLLATDGVNPRFETVSVVEPPRHFEDGCGIETEPTVQIEYGDYVWVRDTASASLVRHFPEPRFWLLKRACTGTSRNVTADAKSRYDRTPRRLHHKIVVCESAGNEAKGIEAQSPSPRHRASILSGKELVNRR